MVGIVSYGAYIPRYRIKIEEIARVWGKDADTVIKGLGVLEKAVAGLDEDTATLAVEATRNAIKKLNGFDSREIGAIFVGSESHPFAVKPTAAIVAEAIGATPNLTAADTEFACKAGTAGIQMCMGMVESGMIKYGLAIGADTAQSMPGDVLEFATGSGAAAFIIGSENVVATIEATYSYTTDTPDFWRRDTSEFPLHGARFTGEPAYFKHVINAAKGLLAKINATVEDFDYVVFHQPNAKFPVRAAKVLGIPQEKIEPGLMVKVIGNTYSGSSLIGLAAVLDVAKPGERILVVSYGSGAGSDAFAIRVTEHIERIRKNSVAKVSDYVRRKRYIDYATYAKFRKKLKGL